MSAPRRYVLALALVGLPAGLAAAEAQPPAIGWQEAVARLAGERTLAESCAGLLKKYGDEAAKAKGALDYGKAKAEVDGVVGGLRWRSRRAPSRRACRTWRSGSRRGVTAREAFCAEVKPLVPAGPLVRRASRRSSAAR